MRLRIACLLVAAVVCVAGCAKLDSAGRPHYSAAELYNLGNSYARAGQSGMAVLNYERARLLAPRDPDIAANLRFVRDARHLAAPAESPLAAYVPLAQPSLVAWAGVLGILVAGVALLPLRICRRHSWLRRGSCLLGVTLLTITVANGVILWPALHEAVVIDDSAAAHVAPAPMGEVTFTLREGEIVKATAGHEGFVLVRRQSGQNGWVPRTQLARVIPST